MTTETKTTTCGICQGGCQVVITLEDGKLVHVAPNSESDKGRLCPRGALAPKFLYSEARIEHPLIRTGERGGGQFREATWDEALDYAAGLIKKAADEYGPRCLATYFGRGVLMNPVMRLSRDDEAFFGQMGSPNDMNCSSICNTTSNMVAPYATLGVPTPKQMPDVENSDYVFSWGKNSATDDGPQVMLKRIKAAQERGAKLVVIDPRETGLGEMADWWIPILPGSDGALALAMLKIIVDRDLYDHDFTQNWTVGFDEFRAYLDSLSPDVLSAQCGVPINDIECLVEVFCSTPKVSLISYTGLEYQLSAVQNTRALYVLWAITGKLDVEGGMYLNAWAMPTAELPAPPEDNAPIGSREYPIFYGCLQQGQFSRIPHAILHDDPYPIRGLIVTGGSPAISFPDNRQWREAYRKLDCLIVIDRFYSEEMRFADVVFPATTLYESTRIFPSPEGPVITEPAIPPVGESRYEAIIFGQLAQRLGFGEKYPRNEGELRSWLLQKPTPYAPPFTLPKPPARAYRKYATGQMRADGQPGFPTPTGKFEIHSTILENAGFCPYPAYDDIRSLEGFDVREWPLLMTTGARSNTRMGGLGGNLEGIGNGIDPQPLVDVNAEDAAEAGIEDGDPIVITTPFGSAPFHARICGMARGAIHVPHGGGSSYMFDDWREGAVNVLTSLDYCDPVTGFTLLKSVPCRIRKAD